MRSPGRTRHLPGVVDRALAPTPLRGAAPRSAPRHVARASVAGVARVLLIVALGAGLASSPRAYAAPPTLPAVVIVAQPVVAAEAGTPPEATGCACQDNHARNRKLGGAASAAMALAGLILAVRRYRQRNRLPREDRKFGSYRGPKS